MADQKTQTFSNHTRFDPPFHFFLIPVFLATVIWAVIHLIRYPGWMNAWIAVFTVAVLLLAFKARTYALKVQDRVIRMEERLRLAALLPESLNGQIDRLTTSQLIALRFASDSEIPALVEKVLSGNLTAKAIKQSIQTWRPDYWRV